MNILLVDDEEKLRALLHRILSLEGYKVRDAGTVAEARQVLKREQVDILLCDVKLPDGNGVDFTKEVKEKHRDIEIILLTAYGNIPDGVRAIKNGALDYIVKGDDNDKIIPLLAQASEEVGRKTRVKNWQDKQQGFDAITGGSPAIQSALQLARKVAPTDTAVLLTGETGTGKEVFARAIHQSSHRADHPFVALNCSAFSKELLESELFGHKAGAFTGAVRDKKGMVEEANGGTLFLDEIGELSPEVQPRLLRLLENGTYIRVGDTREMKADVRIVAATNRDLRKGVEAGHFRSDLYYRIAVFTIELPPLRERMKDVPALAGQFVQMYAGKAGKKITGIAADAMDVLMGYEWKGNVRELKNVIERAVILEDTNLLTIGSLPPELQRIHTPGRSPMQLAEVEGQHIKKVLQYTGGNKTEAARLLGIGLATLYRKVDEYHLK